MPSRLPLVFILITVVIDAMGIGLILPVMPALIEEVNGGSLAQAAVWGGILSFAFAVMQFLFGPTVGSLSDRFGRRPVLLVSLAVMALDYLVMALAGSIWLLLAGRILGGITAATQSTASAFVADITEKEKRAARFGLIGAAFGVGFVLGPLLGGVLGEMGTRAPFYAAAALATLNLVFGMFILPETVTDRTRRAFSWARANPFGAFRHIGALPGVGRLIAMFFLYQVAFFVYPSVWAYYTEARFGWAPGMIGISLASFGISIALVQGALIGVILKRLGDRGTVIYGLCFNFCAFLALALVTDGTVALILTPLTALGAVVTPALQGIMSRTAPDDSQGELQGVLSSTAALAMIVSPLLMTRVFSAFTAADAPVHLPGAPFLVSMALMVACGAVYLTRRAPAPA
ncbi:TCR/Tet family MFS transporter [Oceaniglobus roseus]|uniref:TCR/Tet family MFS transporter n=1 Tax=Oceaniglobus roseus TaxID=1737570 RepID=UPI000C7EE422|nr:TCR/Tet family MFS transporter [Kandeliimicrobium roseum]